MPLRVTNQRAQAKGIFPSGLMGIWKIVGPRRSDFTSAKQPDI